MGDKTRDLLAGAIILGLGLATVAILIPYGVVEPAKVKFAALSPSYYPRIVGGALIIVGLAIVVMKLMRGRQAATEPASIERSSHPHAAWRFLLVVLVLAGFAALIEPLGFVLTSAAVLFTMLLLGGERRIGMLAAISLVSPILLYYFFLKVARIPVPNGLLSGLMPGT